MIANQKKTLRRSRSNRMLAGVCGGLAEFFGISSFWFRLGGVSKMGSKMEG
ncbi:MAG: PspC domain-containing protein [Anaerolineales bacterium]